MQRDHTIEYSRNRKIVQVDFLNMKIMLEFNIMFEILKYQNIAMVHDFRENLKRSIYNFNL